MDEKWSMTLRIIIFKDVTLRDALLIKRITNRIKYFSKAPPVLAIPVLISRPNSPIFAAQKI